MLPHKFKSLCPQVRVPTVPALVRTETLPGSSHAEGPGALGAPNGRGMGHGNACNALHALRREGLVQSPIPPPANACYGRATAETSSKTLSPSTRCFTLTFIIFPVSAGNENFVPG